jgi:hypothetical protein
MKETRLNFSKEGVKGYMNINKVSVGIKTDLGERCSRRDSSAPDAHMNKMICPFTLDQIKDCSNRNSASPNECFFMLEPCYFPVQCL